MPATGANLRIMFRRSRHSPCDRPPVTAVSDHPAEAAVDALRRGRIVTVGDRHGGLEILSAELADAASLAELEGDDRAGLIVTARRAAVLNLTNQRAAAVAGSEPVWIERPAWLDLAGSRAVADPVLDLATPFKGPFRARPLGTEAAAARAAIALAKHAALLPAVYAVPWHGASLAAPADIAALTAAAATVRISARARLPLAAAENTEIVAFRPDDGGPEHLALIVNDPPRDHPVLVRLHSACLTGDVLGSLKCDCGPQLQTAVAAIAAHPGGGVLLYLQQEGRGIGLLNKLRAYALQDQGFDTVDANTRLGFEPDERDFSLAAAMLAALGVGFVRLLTNNPAKVAGLAAHGLTVERVSHQMPPNPHNLDYLATKRDRQGHLS